MRRNKTYAIYNTNIKMQDLCIFFQFPLFSTSKVKKLSTLINSTVNIYTEKQRTSNICIALTKTNRKTYNIKALSNSRLSPRFTVCRCQSVTLKVMFVMMICCYRQLRTISPARDCASARILGIERARSG